LNPVHHARANPGSKGEARSIRKSYLSARENRLDLMLEFFQCAAGIGWSGDAD
jgi:hypothetical protein